MSLQKSDYFEVLKSNASSQVRQELEQMEKSKHNSFKSVGQVLKENYGYSGKTFGRVW